MDNASIMRIQGGRRDRFFSSLDFISHFLGKLRQRFFSSFPVILRINHHVHFLIKSLTDDLVHNKLESVQGLPFSSDEKAGAISVDGQINPSFLKQLRFDSGLYRNE